MDVVERRGISVEILGRREPRRVPALVQRGPAREVEREAEAEADAGLDLAHALQHLFGRDEVDAPELVVVAPVTPGRAGRALRPPLRHVCPPVIGTDRPFLVPTGWSTLQTHAKGICGVRRRAPARA